MKWGSANDLGGLAAAAALSAGAVLGCVSSSGPRLPTTDPPVSAAAASIDLSSPQQTIEGFGASSAWTTPTMDDAHADQFFTTLGLGLTLLRVRITPDGTTDELATAQQAVARGVAVWAAPWSPPAAWKSNGSLNQGGQLLPAYLGAWADRLASFVKTMADAGVPLMALSAQNEPGFAADWETCDWQPADLAAFVSGSLIPSLASAGLTVPVIAPETSDWNKFDRFASAIVADPNAVGHVRALATHSYGGAAHRLPSVDASGVPVWETEYSDESAVTDPGMGSALKVATKIHVDLVTGNVAAWHYWWLNPRGPAGNGALTDGVNLTKRAYVLGNWSRFVRPGFVRVEATQSPTANVLVSAFTDPVTGRLVVVAVNASTADVTQAFAIAGGGAFASLTPWTTSEVLSLVAGAALPVASDGTFAAVLPARSVTTLVADPAM